MHETKYPRTFHLPFSQSLQNDDRCVEKGWETLLNKTLVFQEKLDGEGVMFDNKNVYARSRTSPTISPWAKNLWREGGVLDNIKSLIGENEYIYGENLYGIHSIEYNRLPDYFFMFAARNEERWYSLDEVIEFANILGIKTAPILGTHKVSSVGELEEIIGNYMQKGSAFGDTIEGIVVKNIESYPIDDFSKNVVKYVRKNHVQTDQFWAKNWKKANLIK